MPAKNLRRIFIENGYYHIYNRGVEKRVIFMDEQDYRVYLAYLKDYLSPREDQKWLKQLAEPNITYEKKEYLLKLMRLNNFHHNITLLAYCLMPNHFHLLLKQKDANAIDKFMNSLSTRYTMYFNGKHKRVGPLCQDRYKAVLVKDEPQLLHLSRYIHVQALIQQGTEFQEQYPSSYGDYTGTRTTKWVHPEDVLFHFTNTDSKFTYTSFVADYEMTNNTLKDVIFD